MATTVILAAGLIVALLVVAVLIWAVTAYNRLVRQRTQVRAAWAQIDVQLKRRHSLIPNLVETVRGYAAHERGTLEAVVAARNNAVATAGHGAGEQSAAEGFLTQALGRLFALSEAYPQLKADQNFLALQTELANTEDRISYARQFYNNAVQTYNATVQTVPTTLIAGPTGFRPETYYEVEAAARADVQVRF